jgi:hypothetical protein
MRARTGGMGLLWNAGMHRLRLYVLNVPIKVVPVTYTLQSQLRFNVTNTLCVH